MRREVRGVTNEDIDGDAYLPCHSIPLIIISAVLMTGRGGDFVAGLNTMSRAEREKYDEKAVCKCVGRFTLPLGLMMPFITLSFAFTLVFLAYTLIGAVVVIIRLNKSEKFRR